MELGTCSMTLHGSRKMFHSIQMLGHGRVAHFHGTQNSFLIFHMEDDLKFVMTISTSTEKNMEPVASLRKHFEISDFHMEPVASSRKHFEISDFHMEPVASIRKHFEISDFHMEPLASLRKHF